MTTEAMESVTVRAVTLALDAASLAQKAFATNIANADTQGYVPIRVDFDAELDDARRSLETDGRLDPGTLDDIAPRLQAMPGSGPAGLPPGVTLELELARMAQNAGRYEALVKGLSKHFDLLQIAVEDGKR
jgi:flagellar basal-body rod protein FlgB